MRYILCLLLVGSILFNWQHSTHAAELFSITNVTKFAHLPLKRNTTLETVMATIHERIFLENIEMRGNVLIKPPPAALSTIMAGIHERIIFENVENTRVTLLVAAPAPLRTVMQSIAARIIIENIEQLVVSTLPQLVLSGGVPTGTVVRAFAPANEPSPNATHTPLLTATPTVAVDVTQSPLPTASQTVVASVTQSPLPTATQSVVVTQSPPMRTAEPERPQP